MFLRIERQGNRTVYICICDHCKSECRKGKQAQKSHRHFCNRACYVESLKGKGLPGTNTPEQRKKNAESMKLRWASGIMAEKTRKSSLKLYGAEHWMKTDVGKARMSDMFRGKHVSEETRKRMSVSAANRVRTKRETHHTSARGGFREDLGCYFRSNWEANFARIMTYENKSWQYEPVSFDLTDGTSYTPDFLVEDVYYEVKGRWTDNGKRKFERFLEDYPQCKIQLVDGKEYLQLREKYKHLINWEGK